jgi:hypothetical protein
MRSDQTSHLRLLSLACVVSSVLFGCSTQTPSPHSDPVHDLSGRPRSTETVTVVCELDYYVTGGRSRGDSCRLIKKPEDPQSFREQASVSGFVLAIVEPAEYAGKVLTMHHDGLIPAGDPYKLFEVGKRYRLDDVPLLWIGSFGFEGCSWVGPLPVLLKE